MRVDIEEGLKLQVQVQETNWSSATTSDFSNWLLENADQLFAEIITLRTQNAQLYLDLRARNLASLTVTDETDKALDKALPLITFFLLGSSVAFIVDSNFWADDACFLGAVIFLILWWRRKS